MREEVGIRNIEVFENMHSERSFGTILCQLSQLICDEKKNDSVF